MHANAGPADERAAQVPTALAVVLVVLSLAVAGGAWVAVATRGDRSAAEAVAPAAPDVTLLPSTLAGLPTTTHLTGAEAVDAVTGLHVGDVPVDAAEIADYGGGKVLVWVSWSTASSPEALVKEMTVKIAQGGTPFSAPREPARYDGVWVTVGNGQTHFYFARQGAVWWLAADPDLARTAVTELLGVAG